MTSTSRSSAKAANSSNSSRTGIHRRSSALWQRAVTTGGAGKWRLIPGVDAVARTLDGNVVYTGFVGPSLSTLAERMAVPGAMRIALPAGADPARIAGGLDPGSPPGCRCEQGRRRSTRSAPCSCSACRAWRGCSAVQNAFALGATRVVGADRRPRAGGHSRRDVRTLTGDGGRRRLLARALGDAAEARSRFRLGRPAEATSRPSPDTAWTMTPPTSPTSRSAPRPDRKPHYPHRCCAAAASASQEAGPDPASSPASWRSYRAICS